MTRRAAAPTLIIGAVLLGLLTLAWLAAPLLAPYDIAQQHLSERLRGPDARFLLGTDALGRDLLSRLIFGARAAFNTAVPAIGGAFVLGIGLGALGAYAGGMLDALARLIADVLQSVPGILLAMAVLTLTGPNWFSVVAVLMLAFLPGYIRTARAQVQSLKHSAYADASRALGAAPLRVLLRHVLPNALGPLIVLLALDLPGAVTLDAGLSFLGLGLPPPQPSWGVMLADGFSRIRQSPWPVLWPSLALIVLTLACTWLGEGLRDRLARTSG
jgi:peptide/nickel transport system permease protein